MKIKQNYKNIGFTLIELLVVIAIIGILSSVAIVNLNSARDRARAANARASLNSLHAPSVLCFDAGRELTINNAGTVCSGANIPLANNTICSGSDNRWPTLPSGWRYTACLSILNNQTFYYAAYDDVDNDNIADPTEKFVYCLYTGCLVANF